MWFKKGTFFGLRYESGKKLWAKKSVKKKKSSFFFLV